MRNNRTLKIISGIFGYALWSLLSNGQVYNEKFHVPLCFFNIDKNQLLQAPETIEITIAGKRSVLRSLNTKQLAVHLNAQTFHVGANPIRLNDESLFLPSSLKLVHYTPANLVVQVHEKSHQEH